ncbi:MAG TPA: transcription termination/antitermination protein NusA [Candidatus Aphodocola excrementigallinarum]|uniref:Transcription termination/antitermination protein NusA n=1 Tax=Candidatus Aphodocola excrementigallinarum TaxID=2840670 RepID=A0A9D1IQG9_9FIRM|nr:transcription termination/antitermination protein NusA [Candidatus Aphodocola excrementigallinarum]
MNSKEFVKALKDICKEKQISEDVIFDGMTTALEKAYAKDTGLPNIRIEINKDTGEIKGYSYQKVVDEYTDDEDDDAVEILLEDAKKIVPDIKVGETIEEEVSLKDFGRVATMTAKQILVQKVREAERQSIMKEFEDKEGELLVGTLSREDAKNYYVDLGRMHGILPKNELIKGEDLKMGSSIKVYVTKIDDTGKSPLILLSRSHYGFVKRLLENEIPELNDGTVILYSVARDAGSRSKIAVYSEDENVDAVGACIGEKGSRINRITKELGGEKIDVVKYDKDPITFIKNALSPARDVDVYILDEKKKEALAIAEGDNLSLAIGKKGQNVRLAARLTHYKIDVKTHEQVTEENIDLSNALH